MDEIIDLSPKIYVVEMMKPVVLIRYPKGVTAKL